MSAKSNFALDVAIAAAFLVSCNPPLTGLAVHQWVGVSFAGAVAAHLLFHWNWMVQVTRRAFRRTPARLASQLRGERVAVRHAHGDGSERPADLAPSPARARPGCSAETAWREIHPVATNAMLAGMGVHVGLHWTWVAFHLGRVPGLERIVTPAGRTLGRGAPTPAAQHFAGNAAK